MKVVLLGPFPPPYGGAQAHLVVLRDYLRKRKVTCSVINLTGTRRATADGVYYPRSAAEVLWLLMRLRPDVIHLHFGGHLWPRLYALCLVCSYLPGSRTVLTFHSGGYPSSPEGRSARPASLRGFILRQLDGLIGVNPEIADLFRRFGVSEKRIRVIAPHAVSLADVAAELPHPIANFVGAHRPLLVSVGLLEPEYDLGLQINTLERVRRQFPCAGLVLAGSGSCERELREQIAAKPYGEHILLCGDVPHPVALRLIQEASVLLRTTLYDGDSVAVREALHLGVPVIATDNGMRPEGVRLIPASDPEALERAIHLTVTESPRSANGLPGGEDNLEQVFEFYEELVASKRPPWLYATPAEDRMGDRKM